MENYFGIPNLPPPPRTLKYGERYCIVCQQIIVASNFERHDSSNKHNKNVLTFTSRHYGKH